MGQVSAGLLSVAWPGPDQHGEPSVVSFSWAPLLSICKALGDPENCVSCRRDSADETAARKVNYFLGK